MFNSYTSDERLEWLKWNVPGYEYIKEVMFIVPATIPKDAKAVKVLTEQLDSAFKEALKGDFIKGAESVSFEADRKRSCFISWPKVGLSPSIFGAYVHAFVLMTRKWPKVTCGVDFSLGEDYVFPIKNGKGVDKSAQKLLKDAKALAAKCTIPPSNSRAPLLRKERKGTSTTAKTAKK